MQNRKCQNGRVLVEPVPWEEQKSKSGLTIPDVGKRGKYVKAVVVIADAKTDAKPGEIVYYHPNSATEIVLDGKTYNLVKDTSVELIETAVKEGE